MKRIFTAVLGLLLWASVCTGEEIDVFWLADKGTPQQLQEAAEHGAKFNVARNIYDFAEDENIDNYGWLFDYGETPLHRAAEYNHNPESIRFLIAQSADVNAEATAGGSGTYPQTPLICAVQKNTVEVIRELLKNGANPNHPNTENVFKIAAEARKKDIPTYKEIVAVLVEASADVNAHWEVKPEERRPVLLPKSQWKSSSPLDNMRDDLSNADRINFQASCTPLMFAVFDDNPDIVDILLNVSADANIRNAENKCALDYANMMPEDSKLKKSPVFERLKAATTDSDSNGSAGSGSFDFGFVTAEALNVRDRPGTHGTKVIGKLMRGDEISVYGTQKDSEGDTWLYITLGDFGNMGWISEKHVHLIDHDSDGNTKQLEKMIVMRKVPLYVRDKGKFFYNPEFGIVGIKGKNVRMRSQPNAKARIVDQIGMNDAEKWPDYLGEWTNPSGERWVLADYDKLRTGKTTPVWIFGQYADLMSHEVYAVTLDSIMEAKIAAERAIIDDVRNRMYYTEYSPQLGYAPVGQQLERFFANGEWSVADNNGNKDFEKKLAVFKGIAQMKTNNRRFMFTVYFGKAVVNKAQFKKGNLVLCQININNDIVYRYFMETHINSNGFTNFIDAMAARRGEKTLAQTKQHIMNMMGAFYGVSANQFSLSDFLEMIYSGT